MDRRVVITGMGTVNPLGNSVAAYWDAIRAGVNGIGPFTRIDSSSFPCRVAGQVKDFDPLAVIEKRELRRMDGFTAFAVYAAQEAVDDSGIMGAVNPQRIGTIIGNGIQRSILRLNLRYRDHSFTQGFFCFQSFIQPLYPGDNRCHPVDSVFSSPGRRGMAGLTLSSNFKFYSSLMSITYI